MSACRTGLTMKLKTRISLYKMRWIVLIIDFTISFQFHTVVLHTTIKLKWETVNTNLNEKQSTHQNITCRYMLYFLKLISSQQERLKICLSAKALTYNQRYEDWKTRKYVRKSNKLLKWKASNQWIKIEMFLFLILLSKNIFIFTF